MNIRGWVLLGALSLISCYKSPHVGRDNDAATIDVATDASGGGAARTDAAVDGQSAMVSVVVIGQQANGRACGRDGDCQSGHCRDGVCCNEICTGVCRACAATYTGAADGTCANVLAGTSSRGACQDETATKPCGHDGTCDGQGQCRTVPATQPCGLATCVDAHTFQAAATCDGAGACTMAMKTDCGTYACATTGCATPCATTADCSSAQYCSNGTCKVRKALGAVCAAAAECGSGFCSPDQVCCDKACAGACSACVKAVTGQSDGTCAPVQLGQDPHNDCAAEPAGTCGKDGNCDGKGGCHLYASGTACSGGSCSGAKFAPGKTCDGAGACVASAATMDCGQDACTSDGCKTACKGDADCGAGAYCDKTSNNCAAKKGNGSPCGAGNECTSAACVDAICCNSACSGTCLSCSSAKTGGLNGTCAFIKAGTVDARCMVSDKSSCGQDGNCDGSGQCEKWPSSTVCGAATCSGGSYLAARICNSGTCGAAAQPACGGALCDATSGCRTSCASAGDCTGSNYCDTSTKKCMPLKSNGASCGSDGTQCMSGLCVDGVCCNSKCDGQCQSCATGTCGNSKTARSPCAGSGTCAGRCDGTSAGCTYPGNTTACSSAGCKDSKTVQLAGSCNGSGSCAAGNTQACPNGQLCSGSGSCGCPSGTTDCGASGCINVNGTDSNHCGGCTTVCSAGQSCMAGKCSLGDGQPCTVASQCASRSCNVFYQDVDGDGYGAGPAVGFCGTTTPVGYATQNGDCCDNGTNLAVAKLIHPGADFQSTSAGGVCNITWDYDCSGAVETSWQQCATCSPDTCTCVYSDWPASACGRSQAQTPCGLINAGGAMGCTQGTGAVGPVLCH